MCQYLAGVYVEYEDRREVYLAEDGVSHATCPIQNSLIGEHQSYLEWEYLPEIPVLGKGGSPFTFTGDFTIVLYKPVERFISKWLKDFWPIAIRRTTNAQMLNLTLDLASDRPLEEALKRIEAKEPDEELPKRWFDWPSELVAATLEIGSKDGVVFSDVLAEAFGKQWDRKILDRLADGKLTPVANPRLDTHFRVLRAKNPLVIVWRAPEAGEPIITVERESFVIRESAS